MKDGVGGRARRGRRPLEKELLAGGNGEMARSRVDGLGALWEGGLGEKGEGEVGYLKGYTGAFNAALIARIYRGSIGRFRA